MNCCPRCNCSPCRCLVPIPGPQGPVGPPGATGPAGSALVPVYGTRMGGFSVITPTPGVPAIIPLGITGPSQNVSYGANSDIVVGMSGVYLAQFFAYLASIEPQQGFDYLLTRNGVALTETQGLIVPATGAGTTLVSGHALLTLNAGDAIAFALYVIIPGTTIVLSERIDARLSLIRIDNG